MDCISQLLFENGIIVDTDNPNESLEMDSITFASIIISIESTYHLTGPLDMLLYQKWKTVAMIKNNIEQLTGKSKL